MAMVAGAGELDDVATPGRTGLASWWAPLIAGTAGLVVCLAGMWRPAWSGDESATVVILRRSGAEFWAAVSRDPAVGPYYVLMKVWSEVSMGHSWLRLPSAVAAGVAAGLLFALVRRAANGCLAVTAVAALLVMPAFSRYGQDARPYQLAMMTVVASVYSWWRWMQSRSKRWGFSLVACLTVGGLLHAYSLLIAAPLLAASAAAPAGVRRASVLRTLGVVALVVGLLAPFLAVLVDRAVGQPDLGPVTPIAVVEDAARLPVALLRPIGSPLAAAVALALGAVGAGLLVARPAQSASRQFGVLGAGWLALPPAILILLQWVSGRPGLVARYWMMCLPALAICVGCALLVRWQPWLAATGLTVVAILGLPVQASIRTIDGHQGERWLRIPELLYQPALAQVPLLIQGYSQRGLAANAPRLPRQRTPLNGDPGPTGRVSPIPYSSGTPQFDALVRAHDLVLIYQQRPAAPATVPDARDFRQADDARAVYSEPVVLCQWFGDALGLFAKPGAAPPLTARTATAAAIEAVRPARIECASPG